MNESQWEDAPLECDTDVGVSEGAKLFRFVVHGVLLNGIAAGGVLGNALAVCVLSRPAMRSSTNCLLLGLAGCDTLLLLTSVLLFGLSAVYPYTGLLRDYYTRVCPLLTPVAYPLANAAQTMSVYLTLVVTLERWVAVCRPFRARALCTAARARWYVAATALFALAYNAPKFLEARVTRRRDAAGRALWCVAADTAFRTERYVAVYIHWMYLLVMYALPFSALAALNLCIVRQVRRAQAERARLSRGQRRELGLATMLLVVVLVFFLCNLLPLVTNAAEAFLAERFDDLDPLVKTGNLLVTINSSVNFIIYVIFGEKFKRVFLKMFCARRVRARRGGESPEHTRDDSLSAAERLSLRGTRCTTLRRSERRHAASSLMGSGAVSGAGGGAGSGAVNGTGSGAGSRELPVRRAASPAPAALHLGAPAARWNGHALHY